MQNSNMVAEYIDHMGSDLSVVNSAKASFGKQDTEFKTKEHTRLINYLARGITQADYEQMIKSIADCTNADWVQEQMEQYRHTPSHWSPFSHATISIRLKAPIAIHAQFMKHTVGFSHNTQCFDEQTQVLTDKGWKYWADVSSDDLLAVPSLDFQTYSFEKPKQLFVYDYKGTMLHCHSKFLDMLCTPNHEQPISYYCQRGGQYWTDYKKVQTKDIKGLCFAKLPPLPKLLTKHTGGYDYGYFQGVFLGDGSLSKDGKRIYFHVKKERKKEMLRDLMQRTPELNWVENKQDDGYSYFRCYNIYNFTGGVTDKYIDWRMESSEYYQGLFDGLIVTDGSESKRGCTTYSTVSKRLWEDFLLLCQYIGRETTTHVRDNVPNWNTAYKVTIKKNKPRLIKHIDEVYYDGKVYCAETSTNLLYVRRNGKANISGNSRRYVSDTPDLFIPTFRSKPVGNIKQGSGDTVKDNIYWQAIYSEQCTQALNLYDTMIKAGVAPEQARFVLPQGVMTEWVTTGSLYAWARLYNLRADGHAQQEIQTLAHMIGLIIEPLFPVSWQALVGHRG